MWSELRQFIEKTTGFNLQGRQRYDIFQSLVEKRLNQLNMNIGRYYQYSITEGRDELRNLTEALSVGETYFFRHYHHFQTIRRHLEKKLAHHPGEIRLWSSCCSTGEEAYSLAILLRETNWTNRPVKISIYSSDLNQTALDKAKLGIYSNNSFRNETPIHLKDKYFRRRGTKWEITEEIRDMVHFFPLNLMEMNYPGQLSQLDVVFFRNAMIYLSTAAIRQILTQMQKCMNPGGLLLVSPCETALVSACLFERKLEDESYVFQKKLPSSQKPLPLTLPIALSPPPPSSIKKTQSSPSKKVPLPPRRKKALPPSAPSRVTEVSATLQQSRDAANSGHFLQAAEWALEILEATPHHQEALYLLALAYENLELWTEALEVYQNLEKSSPDFVLTYFNRGEIYLQIGEPDQSREEYKKAEALLTSMDPNHEIPFSEGITVKSLLELLKLRKNS